jgi:uncharacterized iron-regulated membrane protein
VSIRSVLFWCHLAAGVVAGSVVLIMSFTGVILTYEKQMLAWADRRAAAIAEPAPGSPRVSLDAMVATVQREWPDAAVASISQRSHRQAPVSIVLSNGRTVLMHPYTGGLIGEAPATMREVFRTSTEWHRYLAGKGENRAVGKAVTGASNLAFLFIILSGLYLWMPKRWSKAAVAAVAVPRLRHGTSKARDFNWHNAVGIWCAVPLMAVVASATVISYPWASDLVYRLVGETPPPRAAAVTNRPASSTAQVAGVTQGLDRYWNVVEQNAPSWQTISVRLPTNAGAALSFTVDHGMGGEPQKRATVTVEPSTARITRVDSFTSQSTGRRWRSILRFAHTGEVLGLPGQTIAGLASAGACVLMVTGLALAWRRLTAWRRRSASQELPKAA